MKSAAILLNEKIKADSVMKNLFGSSVINIYPGLAAEPQGDNKSYPYLRYFHVPVIQPNNQRIRRDVIQYWAGDVDVDNVVRIVERLIYLTDADDSILDFPVEDSSGTLKIMDSVFQGSVPIALPSQDLGVWEQGITCTLVYTISDNGELWSVTSEGHKWMYLDVEII